MAKRHFGRELWDRMREFVADDDGLPATALGTWTADKLFYVGCYLAQITTAMFQHRSFPGGLVYIDLFCGNGVCLANERNVVRRYPGSALLAAGCSKPFFKLILVDEVQSNLTALRTRLVRLGSDTPVWMKCAEANSVIEEVVKELPSRSLGVAFIDPWSLGARFETIRNLTEGRPIDLLILFPDAIDLIRNTDHYYYPAKSNRLDEAMGDGGTWRAMWDQVRDRDPQGRKKAIVEYYFARLASIGYQYHDAHDIRGGSGPLYKVVFACKHELGLKFWRIAVKEDLHGNKSLFPP